MEDSNGASLLAYCPIYEIGVHGVARVGKKLYDVVEVENYVTGAAISMVGAVECDATYTIGWKRKDDTEKEDEQNA